MLTIFSSIEKMQDLKKQVWKTSNYVSAAWLYWLKKLTMTEHQLALQEDVDTLFWNFTEREHKNETFTS